MKRIVSMTVVLMFIIALLSPCAYAVNMFGVFTLISVSPEEIVEQNICDAIGSLQDEDDLNKDEIADWIKVYNYATRNQASFFDFTIVKEAIESKKTADPEYEPEVDDILSVWNFPSVDVAEQSIQDEYADDESAQRRLFTASGVYGGEFVGSVGSWPATGAGDIDLIKSLYYEFSELKGIYGSGDPEMLSRMYTFDLRLKLFANATQLPVDLVGDISSVRDFTEDNSHLLTLEVPIITTDKISGIQNGVDYRHFVEVANELSAFRVIICGEIGPLLEADQNPPLSSVTKYVQGLKVIHNGLTYVNSAELWNLWNEDIDALDDECGSYNSLAEIHEALLKINAYDALPELDEEDIEEPYLIFFDAPKRTLSRNILYGMSLSAKYIPMMTNVYDPYVLLSAEDTDWIDGFHRYYGFHRKALYIDTSSDAATTRARTDKVGTTRVATLEDLLFAEAEIVLYVDDNFYNVAELADLQDKAFDRLDNVDAESREGNVFTNLVSWIKEVFTVDIIEITKTAEKQLYSEKLEEKADEKFDEYLLDFETIEEEMETDSYSVMQSFAFLSAVYRDSSVFKVLNKEIPNYHPVFVSSPTLAYTPDANQLERNTIFNYLLLKNLEALMPVDYAVNIDIHAPIFMDIYGNILTESGLVVIPAAANASLHGADYTPMNAALLTAYGRSYTLPATRESDADGTLERIFAKVDKTWQIKQISTVSGSLDTSRLSTMDAEVLEELRELYAYDLGAGVVNNKAMIVFISEVLRGAPIENIDYDKEGINPARRLSKSGLLAAQKFEDLLEALDSKDLNATLALPNLAFIDGLEYVILFVYKILVLGVLVIWMVTIYCDAVKSQISWKTIGKCIGTVLLTLALIIGVPACFDITYYQSNKLLLQDETEYLMMLNLEKRNSGVEIGVSNMSAPDISTELYLKLDDIKLNWYDLLDDIMLSSTFAALEEVYADYNEQNLIAGFDGIETMNDGVYISTDTLFNSSSIDFSPTRKTIYQTVNTSTPASFYTPYYAFLDSILGNVNKYNRNNQIYSYTTKIQSQGRVKTVGLVLPYLTSKEFMEGEYDMFDLAAIYGIQAASAEVANYSEKELLYLQNSQWCNVAIDEDEIQKRITKLNEYAREWVAKNRHLIGKITDETFLKAFALSTAIEHNKLFGTMRADAIEIYNLSNEDLLRLSMEDEATVMRHSPSSFARFVYDTSGLPGVYAGALLTVVTFVSSWVKPLVTLAVFVLTFISIFVFKMLLRKDSQNLYGYAVTIGILCSVNILHSLMIKLSMYLPTWGLKPVVCIILQIIIQLAYMVILLWVVTIAAKDWRNLGFTQHQHTFNRLVGEYSGKNVRTPTQQNGWEYYNTLVERQKKRVRRL